MYEAVVANPDGTLEKISLPEEELGEHDIRVKVKAAGVNPVDGKQREVAKAPKILGYDGVGIVTEVGLHVQKVQVGDRVFYSGDVNRAGSFATEQVVREELVALAPHNLTDVEAASIPLTFLTAYELLVDKFGLTLTEGGAAGRTLFIINGVGAVGRVMTQLAKWMGMQVITTASQLEGQELSRELGADFVVNHYDDYVAELQSARWDTIPYIAILHEPNQHFANAAELIAPFGHIGLIVAPYGPVDIGLVKNKAVSIDWEFMFAKASIETKMSEQGFALQIAGQLAADEVITPFIKDVHDGLSVESIEKAMQTTLSGSALGKQVIPLSVR